MLNSYLFKQIRLSPNTDVAYPEVLEAYQHDVGHGIARLDKKSMNLLDIHENDIIEIQAKRATVAICKLLSNLEDRQGTYDLGGYIRIDGVIRNNAGAEIGDVVTIKKVQSFSAYEITIEDVEENPPIEEIQKMNDSYLQNFLYGITCVKGDVIALPHKGNFLLFEVIEAYPLNYPVTINRETIFHVTRNVDIRKIPEQNRFLNIVKERYAKGEITKEAYDNFLEDLKKS